MTQAAAIQSLPDAAVSGAPVERRRLSTTRRQETTGQPMNSSRCRSQACRAFTDASAARTSRLRRRGDHWTSRTVLAKNMAVLGARNCGGTMESRTKLLGHPVHQMLIVFPLGLLAMAVIFDVLAIAAGNGYWSEIAYWMITAGCITGLLAAPFGFIDWLAIRAGTRAKRIGAVHGLGNVVVLLMFAGSRLLRGTLRERPFRPRLRCRSWPALSPCLPAGSEASSWTASRSASTMAPT